MILLLPVISFVGTIAVIVFLNNIFGIELQSFSILFIIPIGALIVGYLGSVGISVGHLISNKYAGRKMILVGAIIGVLTYMGIYYASYLTTYIAPNGEINYWFNGNPISHKITFFRYLQIELSSAKHTFLLHGIPVGSYKTGKSVNTIGLVIQLLAAACGGIGGGVVAKEYCQKCQKYKKERKLFMIGVNEYKMVIKSLPTLLNDVPKLKALMAQEQKSTQKYENGYFSLELQYCPDCFENTLYIKAMKRKPKSSSFEEVIKMRQTLNLSPELAKSILISTADSKIGTTEDTSITNASTQINTLQRDKQIGTTVR